MSDILHKYNSLKKTPSDINEHLPTLKSYAEKVDHITEFGPKDGNSTIAFLAGKPKKLISYDVVLNNSIQAIVDSAEQEGLNYYYVIKDVLSANIEPTQILFINTKHTYNQLKAELSLHSNKVEKYIILHYTVTFGYTNEVQQAGKKEGLMPAIEEFLQAQADWKVHEKYTNNKGLLILKRIG